MHYRNFMARPPTVDVAVIDIEGKVARKIHSTQDKSYDLEGSGGQPSAVVIKAFHDGITVSYDASAEKLLIADTASPSFQVLSKDHESTRIKVPLFRQDVTKDDVEEFNQLEWIVNNPFLKASFPEKKPFYSRAIAVKGLGYLVYTESPYYHNIKGLVVNPEGETVGRFKFDCGENGTFLAARGRLFVVRTDTEGDFEIFEARVKALSVP